MVTNPGKLKLTVQKFYRVDGTTTQRVGVTPDIILPSAYDYMEIGESSLPNSLPATTNAPVSSYPHLDLVKSYLADLKQRSEKRLATDKDFTYINEDIELLKKKLAQPIQKSEEIQESYRVIF